MQKNINNLSIWIFVILFLSVTNNFAKNTYICTSVYCDLPGEESFYPNVWLKSSSAKFQEIYWQCAMVMFASSIRYNPQAIHILFTNKKSIPGPFNNFLKKFNVRVVYQKMSYKTPKKYYHSYRNTFYFLDIINYLSSMRFKDDDTIVLLDSDCFWVGSINQSLYKDVENYGLLNYHKMYSLEHKINGLTRLEAKQIYEDLLTTHLNTAPDHYGGGVIIAAVKDLRKMASEFKDVWYEMMQRFKRSKTRFHTEEHIFSYIYHKLGYLNGKANNYLTIIQTDGNDKRSYQNASLFLIWHLPLEKRKGFVKLFQEITNPKSNFWHLPLGEQFIKYCGKKLSVF